MESFNFRVLNTLEKNPAGERTIFLLKKVNLATEKY